MRRSMTNFLTGLREIGTLARPYFSSEERFFAWSILGVVIVLNLLMVGMNVILNFWNRDFFNAIQAYDAKTAIYLLFLYVRPAGGLPMPGFAELVTLYVLVAVYAFYLNQMLQIRWRRWMTRHYVANWLSDRAYYTIMLRNAPGRGLDNPDQRISEDIRDFTASTLSLGLDLLSNLVTLLSFVFVLYEISGSIKLFGITIPGYMLWVAVIYSALGTWLTHLIGRKLIPLSFNQQKLEANFRYNLVRVRENPEAIALFHGEPEEQNVLNEAFERVRDNFWTIMRRTKALNFFTVSFAQIANIFPVVFALPRFFSHQIQLGGLTQIQDAFAQVQGALSWFINSYQNLVTYRATIARLYGFTEAVAAARLAAQNGPHLSNEDGALKLKNLTLTVPDGRRLLNNASLTLPAGLPITLTGPSGSGKSTLFRAIAGIWPFGSGEIIRPKGKLMFLPQKPYFPIGKLKRSVSYPRPETEVDDAAVQAALRAVELPGLVNRIHEEENWGHILSGGEQQRLAIARAIVNRPAILIADEPTANLDHGNAQRIMNVFRDFNRVGVTTLIASHDTELMAGYANRMLCIPEAGKFLDSHSIPAGAEA
jgi:putative ATP-binding cassette transporter